MGGRTRGAAREGQNQCDIHIWVRGCAEPAARARVGIMPPFVLTDEEEVAALPQGGADLKFLLEWNDVPAKSGSTLEWLP